MKPLKLAAQLLALAAVAGLLGLLAVRVVNRGEGTGLAAAIARGETPAAPNFDLPRLDQAGTLSLVHHLTGRDPGTLGRDPV